MQLEKPGEYPSVLGIISLGRPSAAETRGGAPDPAELKACLPRKQFVHSPSVLKAEMGFLSLMGGNSPRCRR